MKKNEKMLSVGEVAKSLGITRRIIINYEDKGLILPDIKEGDVGNRYYTMDTFTRIRTIRVLQNMGLTLDEIRGYYDDSTDLTPMLGRLETLRDELNLNIEKIRERINTRDEPKIHMVTLPEQTIYRRVHRDITVEEKKEHLRDIVLIAVREYGTDTSKRMYFTEISLDAPELVSYCAAVPPGSKGEFIAELPETQAICMYHHGAYETIPAVRERLICYARENNLKLSGKSRHIYLEGPPHHKDVRKYITQVALPLAEECGEEKR